MQIRSKEGELSELFCSNADHQSFKAVYDFYWDYLFLVAFNKSKSNDIAEDLVQETFINLCKYRSKLAHVKNLRIYLTTMLKYQFLKGIKLGSACSGLIDPLSALQIDKRDDSITLNGFQSFVEAFTDRIKAEPETKSLKPEEIIKHFGEMNAGIYTLAKLDY